MPASTLRSDNTVTGLETDPAATSRRRVGRAPRSPRGAPGTGLPGDGYVEEPRASTSSRTPETGLNAGIDETLLAADQTYVCEEDAEAQVAARYVVYSATAEGEIPGTDQLEVSSDEIVAARWFETLPGNLHDDDLLRPYL